jgi:APA family basic amino acid/polyamine antiporter
VKVAILAGFTSVIMVMLLGQSRIFYTMAHDGLLPARLGKIKDSTHVPLFTTILITIIGMVVAGLFPVAILGQIVSMATLMGFAIVCFAVLILRYKQPNLHRPFKTPFMPWIPLFGGIACVVQIALLPVITLLQLVSWLGIGCIIYFTYSMKRSKVRRAHKKSHS